MGVTKPKGQGNSSPDEGFSLPQLSARSLTCTFDCRLGHIFLSLGWKVWSGRLPTGPQRLGFGAANGNGPLAEKQRREASS